MLRQTEEDADKEILELKTRYEKQLRGEKDANVRLRGESGILKKKFSTAVKDGEEHKTSIHRMGAENARLAQTIRNLEKDITDLKKEIRGRDEAIGEKEKRIAELKRGAVELGKNRYVKLKRSAYCVRPKLSALTCTI